MCPPQSDNGLDVGPACDGPLMKEPLQLRGIELRYALTMHLCSHGPASITELVDALAWHGFAVAGRASKSISDALRWEMGYGRVRRLGRGRYGPGYLPRGTEHRIHKRVMALRDMASCRYEAGKTRADSRGDACGTWD
jgi:hypothetical protein